MLFFSFRHSLLTSSEVGEVWIVLDDLGHSSGCRFDDPIEGVDDALGIVVVGLDNGGTVDREKGGQGLGVDVQTKARLRS